MRTIGRDTSSQSSWDSWLEAGKEAVLQQNIPLAMVVGDEDGVFNTENSKKFKQMFEIPDESYHTLEGVGHLPMLEKAEEVSQILFDFLCSGLLECVQRPNSSGN
jgi:pimeloyl-ACP methyl ester carboxylesterase